MRILVFRLGVQPLAVLILACPGLLAQCTDPPVPAGGFPITTAGSQLVTYSDLYRTLADVRHPATAPGICGWPLLIGVHGFPSSRTSIIATHAADLAAQGYFVVVYDVRGQGSAVVLNPGRGSTLMALNEWIDLFEVIEWAAATYPGLADPGRVGVFGVSQGGAHSWAAAAWSGRTPPPNPRRSAPFPMVHAVVPFVMVPSHTEAGSLGGTAFKDTWGNLAFNPPGPALAMDPALQQTMQGFLLSDDPEGLATWMRNDPGRDFVSLLPASTVPVFVMMAWLDVSMPANPSLRALQAMPATTPRRIYLSTGMHGTAVNDYEWERIFAMRQAWFDRFLKGSTEPIESGPPVLSAALPADHATYLAGSSLWRHRADAGFPPGASVMWTLCLRQGALLSPAAPTVPEAPETVVHTVPPGYNVQSWRAAGSGHPVGQVLAQIPLSSHAYTTAPLLEDMEIAGIPRLHLEVTPTNDRFLLAARLEVLSPGGGVQVLAQGGLGVRQAGGPTPTTVLIDLSAIDCVVPQGSRLRLSVRNHFLVSTTTTMSFRFMPYFSPYQVDIEHKPGAVSRLELPLRAEPCLDVTTAATEIPLPVPTPIGFQLRSSQHQGGAPYGLLGSATGQGPAMILPGGGLLYLVPDDVTWAMMGGAMSPLLPGFVGILDPSGGSTATMDLAPLAPLPVELAGKKLYLAPVALRTNTVEAGAPLVLTFR